MDVFKKLMLDARVCCCRYVFRISFIFQPNLYDDCPELLQKAVSFEETAIVSLTEDSYWMHFCSKSIDVINILIKANIVEKNVIQYKNV